MELLLIRHGLPERVERDDGLPADPPLAPRGREQAERLAHWLAAERIDALYTSPLRRAHETALPLAQRMQLELAIEPGVAELDQDSSTYLPLDELKASDPERWRALVQGGLYAGVDLVAFQQRVIASLERVIAAHPGQRVAVVCHGGVINGWARHVLGVSSPLFLFFDPTYTSINRFMAAKTGERSLVSLNEAAHLR